MFMAKTGAKGQTMVVDLVPAVLVFLLISGGIAWVWSTQVLDSESLFLDESAVEMAETSLENLVESPGYPNAWERSFGSEVEILGLSKSLKALHPNKVNQFFWRTAGLERGLVAEWHMNNNLDDASGNGNSGTCYGSEAYGEGKWLTQALKLDGSSYVEIGEKSEFRDKFGFEEHKGTVSAWFKTESSGKQTIASRIRETGTNGWKLWIEGENVCFTVSVNSYEEQHACYPSGLDLTQGWHHAAGVWDQDRIALYFDGAFVSEKELPDGYAYSRGKDNMSIGMDNYTKSWYFEGMVEEARIYGRALDQFEVDALQEWTGPFAKQVLGTGANDYRFRLADPETGETKKNGYGDLLESGKKAGEAEQTRAGNISMKRIVTYNGGAAVAELVIYRKA